MAALPAGRLKQRRKMLVGVHEPQPKNSQGMQLDHKRYVRQVERQIEIVRRRTPIQRRQSGMAMAGCFMVIGIEHVMFDQKGHEAKIAVLFALVLLVVRQQFGQAGRLLHAHPGNQAPKKKHHCHQNCQCLFHMCRRFYGLNY